MKHIDFVYVTSYNECDERLVVGLRDAFARLGKSFAVLGYVSRYVEDLHRCLGVDFINLRKAGPLRRMDPKSLRQIEAWLGSSVREFIFPESMGYRSSARKLMRRLVAIHEGYEEALARHRIGCFVHKLGAELVRRLAVKHAEAIGATTIFLGNFPPHYPGRIYLHSQLWSERDDRQYPAPNLHDSVSFEEFCKLLDRIRDRQEVIRYPAPGGRTWREISNILLSLARHGEFEFIDDMARRRLVMFQQFYRQAITYLGGTDRMPEGKFYYFPLHVHDDSQITLRNPQFCDQTWILEYLSRSLPADIKLAVKFHPGLDGSMPWSFVRRLRALDNIVVLRGAVNSHEVVKRCAGVIVINSTVAFEALLHEKPVLVLGRWAFGRLGMTLHVDDLAHLSQALIELQRFRVDPQRLRRTLYDLYGEMYECSFNREPVDHDRLAGALLRYAERMRDQREMRQA